MHLMFWYFMIYSALGLQLERAYALAKKAENKSRKCLLLLPICPVYGLGAVGILLLPPSVKSRYPLLFLCCVAVTTAAEFLMHWVNEKVFRVSFWDYSEYPFHVQGRICLRFSLAWGFLSLVLVYLLQPMAALLAGWIPPYVTVFAMMLLAADVGLTARVLRKYRNPGVLRSLSFKDIRRLLRTGKTEYGSL